MLKTEAQAVDDAFASAFTSDALAQLREDQVDGRRMSDTEREYLFTSTPSGVTSE